MRVFYYQTAHFQHAPRTFKNVHWGSEDCKAPKRYEIKQTAVQVYLTHELNAAKIRSI
jgi:hypothetical protein